MGLLFSFSHLDYISVFSLPFTVITANPKHCPLIPSVLITTIKMAKVFKKLFVL